MYQGVYSVFSVQCGVLSLVSQVKVGFPKSKANLHETGDNFLSIQGALKTVILVSTYSMYLLAAAVENILQVYYINHL